jgi:hypothetical protein
MPPPKVGKQVAFTRIMTKGAAFAFGVFFSGSIYATSISAWPRNRRLTEREQELLRAILMRD